MGELPVVFDCAGEHLVGIATVPDQPCAVGLLILVGGPQYRVGSHRQFVHLARFLAAEGFPSFRFDFRGMGDSSGTGRSFENVDADIHAAARAFLDIQPDVKRLVVFGLCDGGSAALMSAATIENLAGLIIANPWVRQGDSLNQAVVRHYYLQRFFSAEFWKKLCSGKLPLASAGAEFFRRVSQVLSGTTASKDQVAENFVDRMRRGWQLPTPRLLLMSGQDLTAREFADLRSRDARWRDPQSSGEAVEIALPGADHTFSQTRWRDEMHAQCRDFLRTCT